MKHLQKLFFVAALFIISCEGPIGPEGPAGPVGDTGATGDTGADGNANVQTFIFTDPVWGGDYGPNAMSLLVPAITQTVFDEDLILCYIYVGTAWYSSDTYYYDGYFRSYIPNGLGEYIIKAYNNDDTIDATLPTVAKAKVIIIESSSTSSSSGNGRSASPQEAIMQELDAAGVDINNYYEVAAYYNLNN